MKNKTTFYLYIVQVKFEAAHAVSIYIIAERWRHAPTKVTPQVLKSSIVVFLFFLLSFFYLITSTPPLHSSSLSVHLNHFAPHHLLFSSPVKWSLRPVWSPDQLPPPSLLSICQSRSAPDCLPYFFTLSFLCSSGCLFLTLSFSFAAVLLSPYMSLYHHLTFLFFFCPFSFPSFLYFSPSAFLSKL